MGPQDAATSKKYKRSNAMEILSVPTIYAVIFPEKYFGVYPYIKVAEKKKHGASPGMNDWLLGKPFGFEFLCPRVFLFIWFEI